MEKITIKTSLANRYKLPIMITTPTRRANKDRITNSKYNKNIIEDNVSFLKEIRSAQWRYFYWWFNGM